MKKGYTLAEILIALCIVGVLVAVMIPLINRAKPVSEKAMYLKTYDSIVTAVHSIANNKKVYPVIDDDKHINYSEYPLVNLAEATFADQTVKNNDKLAQVLKQVLNGNGDGNATEFTTPNGTKFKITRPNGYNDQNGLQGHFLTQVSFNLKDSKTEFKVYVYADGKVVPADDTGAGYINTRVNWFKRGSKGTLKNNDANASKYTLKCMTGYTFISNEKGCSSVEIITPDEDNKCTPAQINAKILECAKNNRNPKYDSGSVSCTECGDCSKGYEEINGKCKEKITPGDLKPYLPTPEVDYNWSANGMLYYRCDQSLAGDRMTYQSSFHGVGVHGATEQEARYNLEQELRQNFAKYIANSGDGPYASASVIRNCNYDGISNVSLINMGEYSRK